MTVWRICDRVHAGSAFSGEGAKLYGARWNPRSVPMVYTACSFPLAILELFVNLDGESDPGTLVSIQATLPTEINDAERISVSSLPSDWKRVKHEALKAMGRGWAESRRSLVLLVPSVAADGEWNALVNPEHPDAAKIRIVETKPFLFDPRMFK